MKEILDNAGLAAMLDPLSDTDKSEKIIRKSLSIPAKELMVVKNIRSILESRHICTTDSEILRIGLSCLNNLSEEELINEYSRLKKIQTGRPKKK